MRLPRIATALTLAACLIANISRVEANPPQSGVTFNGGTSYAEVPDGRPFDLDCFTLAVWVKSNRQKTPQVFLNRGAAGELFTLYAYHDKVRMLVEYEPGKYTHANVPRPAKGKWVHLVGSLRRPRDQALRERPAEGDHQGRRAHCPVQGSALPGHADSR